MNSIPASELVNVIPGVLGAGGNPLSLNAVFATRNPSIPVNTVPSFANLTAVRNWFGGNSAEAALAAVYFSGFTGCSTLPGLLYFVQYNTAAVSAYLRGGKVSGLTLAELQALSGTVIVAVNGKTVTSANIDLSTATSFSNAAALIETGLKSTTGIFSGTATIDDGAGSAGTVLTVSAVASGVLHVGDLITMVGVTPGTTVTAFVSGSQGGIGVYTVSAPFDVGPIALTVAGIGEVSYDAQLGAFQIASPTTGDASTIGFASGTLSPDIFLTSPTGAVLSQGAAIAVPGELMDSIVAITQNWATFMTVEEVALEVKEDFAVWFNTSNQRYAYIVQDSDVTALTANAAGSFGAIMAAAEYNGVVPIWDPSGLKAALICAIAASTNWAETNGRTSYAYRGQAGLTADITDATVAANLIGNGYNFYGAYATANDSFVQLQPGSMPGIWTWIDPYINQIYLNSQLQLAYMSFLTQSKSVPYNATGYNSLRAVAADPIAEALNNGTIRAGVQLSAAQINELNLAAESKIDAAVFQSGYYLKIVPAPAQVRAERESPAMTLWYTDGGSIQKITLSSIDVM